jgi:hypothetical protein
MPQPPAYAPAFSFTDWTASYPTTPLPGVRVDTEYQALATTLAAIRTTLALIQRDDGQLGNATVGADQLTSEITLGLRSVSNWTTATAYVVNDGVWTNGLLYLCEVAHTSAAAFATDLAAGKWTEIFDPADVIQDAVNVGIANGSIIVGVDISTFAGLAANNTFTGVNSFSNTAVFTAAPSFAAGNATTAADYWAAKPTDYGAGKPGVFLRKKVGATAWELEIDDGAGGSGSLDIVVSSSTALTLNGSPIATAASVTALEADVRRARALALANA